MRRKNHEERRNRAWPNEIDSPNQFSSTKSTEGHVQQRSQINRWDKDVPDLSDRPRDEAVPNLVRRTLVASAAGLLVACDRVRDLWSAKKMTPNTEPDSPAIAAARAWAEANLPPGDREGLIEKARIVDKYYSTAPITARYAGRVYVIPANYYTPFEAKRDPRTEFTVDDASGSLGSWHFFWPDFRGYDKENWFDEFSRDKIIVRGFSVRPSSEPDFTTDIGIKNAMDGGRIESNPNVNLLGLRGHRLFGRREFVWIGKRSNGQTFRMESFHPDDIDDTGRPNPQCIVKLDEPTPDGMRESLAYTYSLKLFKHWRQIDDGVATAMASWRVK